MSSTGSIRNSAAGFTLLEMMVVLAILALALTVVPVHLVLDRESMRLTIDGSQQIGVLSKSTTFGIVGQGTLQARTPTIVQFYPEGGSSGGELLLSYERHEYRVSVNWLTGAVSTIRK
jgi:prepilin-type N-terminal cleavage/methylation domain-containing protein